MFGDRKRDEEIHRLRERVETLEKTIAEQELRMKTFVERLINAQFNARFDKRREAFINKFELQVDTRLKQLDNLIKAKFDAVPYFSETDRRAALARAIVLYLEKYPVRDVDRWITGVTKTFKEKNHVR